MECTCGSMRHDLDERFIRIKIDLRISAAAATRQDKRMELTDRWIASDKSTRIPISTFQLALELHGVEVDMDEVECMLANMVFRVSALPFNIPLTVTPSSIFWSGGGAGIRGRR